jgi:hypothetical protein
LNFLRWPGGVLAGGRRCFGEKPPGGWELVCRDGFVEKYRRIHHSQSLAVAASVHQPWRPRRLSLVNEFVKRPFEREGENTCVNFVGTSKLLTCCGPWSLKEEPNFVPPYRRLRKRASDLRS